LTAVRADASGRWPDFRGGGPFPSRSSKKISFAGSWLHFLEASHSLGRDFPAGFKRGAHGSAGNLVLKFRGPHLWRLGSAHLRTKRSGSGSRGDSRDRKPSPARWQWHSGDERVPARSARATARRHWWPDLGCQSEVKSDGQSRWSPRRPRHSRWVVPRSPRAFGEACLFLDVHPLLARCAAHSGEKSPSALMILFPALWLPHCFPNFAEKCKRCR